MISKFFPLSLKTLFLWVVFFCTGSFSSAQKEQIDEIFTDSPVAAYLVKQIYDGLPAKKDALVDELEKLAESDRGKLKEDKSRNNKFYYKGKTGRLTFFYDFDGGYRAEELLTFETSELFGTSDMKEVAERMKNIPGWKAPSSESITHIRTGVIITFDYEPANGEERAFFVQVRNFADKNTLIRGATRYEFFNVNKSMVQFPSNGTILTDCGNKQIVHYGNAYYIGTMENSLPNDLSGNALLIFVEKYKTFPMAKALMEESICKTNNFNYLTEDEETYGKVSIVKGKFEEGVPIGEHINSTGEPYLFENSNSGLKFYTRAELKNYLFDKESIAAQLFEQVVVNDMTPREFLDHRRKFFKMLKSNHKTKKSRYKPFYDLPQNKQYLSYSASEETGSNIYKVIPTAFDIESSSETDKKFVNLYMYKGENEKLKFMGKSSCSDIIAALEQSSFPFSKYAQSKSIIVDLREGPTDLKDLYAELTFKYNELVQIHLNQSSTQHYSGLSTKESQENTPNDEPFCVDAYYVAHRIENSAKIQKMNNADRAGDIVDGTRGICITGCDDSNGLQLIHFGDIVYYGPVKNGLPHDESQTAVVGVIDQGDSLNRTALLELKEYSFRYKPSSVAINGLLYLNVLDYNQRTNKAIKMVDLNILGKTVYTEVILKDQVWYPSGESPGLYYTKDNMEGTEDLAYMGNVDSDFLPNGEGILVWESQDSSQVAISGNFKHGWLEGKPREIKHKGRLFKNVDKFSMNKQGDYSFSGDAITMENVKNGTTYKAIGKWEDEFTPAETHKVWYKNGENWVGQKDASFRASLGIQLDGPDIFGINTAHEFFDVDESYRIDITNNNRYDYVSYDGFMPFYSNVELESMEGNRRKVREFITIGGADSKGEVKLEPTMVGEGLYRRSASGYVYFGNPGKQPVRILLFEIRMREDMNTAFIDLLGEINIEGDYFAKYLWEGDAIFGSRNMSGNINVRTALLSPWR